MAQQHGRKKTTASGRADVYKRGEGGVSGGKPVGRPGGYSAKDSHPAAGGFSGSDQSERGVLSSMLGSGSSSNSGSSSGSASALGGAGILSLLKTNKTARIIAIILVVLVIYWAMSNGMCSAVPAITGGADSSLGVAGTASTSQDADLSVSNLARDKRTVIRGSGSDVVTIMVYMCGTDLESKYGMATNDLQEMISANIGDNVNLLVETGGCSKWKNNTVSNTTNQIYKVVKGGLVPVENNLGKKAMTDPATLSQFIQYSTKNYPADRYGLIFWDHGGGSISGYGYDELFPGGSMSLDKINTALRNGGCTFDFIGFDACLMATLETALVTEQYADYLIASEETEPGVGWYYTNWLTELSKNTSMPTVELGKRIIDDFVAVCGKSAPGDKTTLSIIDLAEVSGTVPESFTAFAKSTSELIDKNEYQQISDARGATREFASGINQVDLIDLAQRIGTEESKNFAKVLNSCVKYNRTSRNIANANGISIYFPYGKSSSMNSALSTYNKIGLDSSYSECIKDFASVSTGGQIASGGGASLLDSLFGSTGSSTSGAGGAASLLEVIGQLGGSTGASSGSSNADLVSTMLSMFLSNRSSAQLTGIDAGQNEEWFDEESVIENSEYFAENYLDPDHIVVTQNEDGKDVLSLTEDEWDLVQNIELNVFFDDGEGYIDLGMDNVFERDEKTGDLFIDYDCTWLTLNGHIVSYYMVSEDWNEDETYYVITGRIPALINGERMDIMVEFSTENEQGIVSGARPVYDDETDTVARGLYQIADGDKIDFLCDYYRYDKSYQDSYYLGEQMTVNGDLELKNMDIGDSTLYSYCLTDIFGNELWTPAQSSSMAA